MSGMKAVCIVSATIILSGCGNDRRNTSDFPLNQVNVASQIWLEPETAKGLLQVDYISAGEEEEQAPALGTISASALLTGGDSIRVVSAENLATVSRFPSNIYGVHFELGDPQNVSIQYLRNNDVQNEVQISLNQNLSPSIDLSSRELNAEVDSLNATLDFGLEEGFELPNGANIGVLSQDLYCEKDGVRLPLTVQDNNDPINWPRTVASNITRTLTENDLTVPVDPAFIAANYEASYRAGTVDSCFFEIRAVISFQQILSNPFVELMTAVSNNKSPDHQITVFVYSSPQIISIDRSAL